MSKHKFVLAPKVSGFVEWQLERYHADKKQLELFKNDLMPSATASYSLLGEVSNRSVSNPTESVSIKIVTDQYRLSTERSCLVIEHVLSQCDETDMKLVDLIYWKQSYMVIGAGLKAGLVKSSTYQRVNAILRKTALEMGLVNI